jgi:hypothetical protein
VFGTRPSHAMSSATAAATAATAEYYKPPPPHKRPADAAEFLASLDETNRQLHELAQEQLGSSYFMDRCHSYKAWKKAQAASAATARAE